MRTGLKCLLVLAVMGVCPASALANSRIVVESAATNGPTSLDLVDPVGGAAEFFAGPNLSHPSWSQDGSTIAFYDFSRGIVLKAVADGAERVLLPTGRYNPSLSPASDEIAYWEAQSSSYVLKVTRLDGQSTRTLTQPVASSDFGGVGDRSLGWSPDGKSIAFPYQGYIVKVSAQQQGPLTPIVPAEAGTVPVAPAFSPDGTRLAYLKYYNYSSGFYERARLLARRLDTGALTTVWDHVCCQGSGVDDYHGPQSWSPDSKQIAYAHQACTQTTCDATLNIVNADGTGDLAVLHRLSMRAPSWSRTEGPEITIQAPQANARLTGREAVGAPVQQLRVHIESVKPLAGVCYRVQTEPTPVPDKASCTNASGPASAPFDFATDLRPLIDAGTIKPGENVIRVWAYDEGGARGSAEVKVVLARANYYIKHVEVAQALSPPFAALQGADPLQAAPTALAWSLPSLASFPVPLIAGRSPVLRIYVGDATQAAGATEMASIRYRVAAGSTTMEGDQTVAVTAADVAPAQGDTSASINVWLPASVASSAAPLTAEVEVNAGQATAECDPDCYPNGNRATLSGIAFEHGGSVSVRAVPILVVDAAGKIQSPDPAYSKVFAGGERFLPVADGGVAVAPAAGSVIVTVAELTTAAAADPADDAAKCGFVYDRVALLRGVSGGGERWVGTASPTAEFDCNGMADEPGTVILLTLPRDSTFAHELGHSLGVAHTRSLIGRPATAPQLPYEGIGAFGYARLPAGVDIYEPDTTSDLMGYDETNGRWTSPATWSRMHAAIGGAASASLGGRAAAANNRAATATRTSMRRLVSGYLAGDHGVIFESVLAPASSLAAEGPVAAKVVALDRRGRALASADVRGTQVNHDGAGEILPFVVALPPTATAAAVALRAPSGKPLDSIRRSRHAPVARFVRLPRRAAARRPLTVRWLARDADRDPVSVILQARRGKAWRTLTLGPGRGSFAVDPRTLGVGKALGLRLRVGDGFHSAVVTGRRIALRR